MRSQNCTDLRQWPCHRWYWWQKTVIFVNEDSNLKFQTSTVPYTLKQQNCIDLAPIHWPLFVLRPMYCSTIALAPLTHIPLQALYAPSMPQVGVTKEAPFATLTKGVLGAYRYQAYRRPVNWLDPIWSTSVSISIYNYHLTYARLYL